MAHRLEQNAKRRTEKKNPTPVVETALPRLAQEIDEVIECAHSRMLILSDSSAIARCLSVTMAIEQAGSLLRHPPSPAEAWGASLWHEAVESLGRSAGVLEELAESTGKVIALIAARGDRIDRIQSKTREPY